MAGCDKNDLHGIVPINLGIMLILSTESCLYWLKYYSTFLARSLMLNSYYQNCASVLKFICQDWVL